jgi:nucleoside-diphosphate-sugar epimerase
VKLLHSDHPGPVNLGNPHEITIGELAAMILELTGSGGGIEYISSPPDDPRRRCPDIGVAMEDLEWRPTVSLAHGLQRAIDWFRGRLRDPVEVAGQR